MKPDDIATAIAQAIAQGGAQWVISTIAAFLPVLWTTVLIMHLGRPYIVRTLRRCGLRLGADIWWMSYLLIRDGVLLLTFAMSWIFFQPNLVATSSFPITAPLAALCLLLTLGVKLSRRTDDDIAAYRLSTAFLVAGATLYYLAQVFGVEAADQEALKPISDFFTSSSNVPVALGIMWVSLAGMVVVAGWLFIRLWMHATRTMAQRIAQEQKQTPAQEQVA